MSSSSGGSIYKQLHKHKFLHGGIGVRFANSGSHSQLRGTGSINEAAEFDNYGIREDNKEWESDNGEDERHGEECSEEEDEDADSNEMGSSASDE